MNVTEALSGWQAYRRKLCDLGLVQASTLHNQFAIVGGLEKRLGYHSLAGLRKSHIELWMGERLLTCSPLTVRGEFNVLRQVLRWCQDEGHLAALPRFPKLSVPAVEKALPHDEAFLWVLANVPPQHARALEFMMLTGLSPHELERVERRDIGGSAGPVLFIGKRPDFMVKQASRRRDIRLNERAAVLWFEAAAGLADTDNPFPTVAAMQKAIRRAAVAKAPNPDAGDITPKMMRKWFASKVANDHPEHVLQRLLGHAPGSPITRAHYVRSTDEQLSTAAEGVKI